MIKQFQYHKNDLGNSAIQGENVCYVLNLRYILLVGIMTVRIKNMQEHLKMHKMVKLISAVGFYNCFVFRISLHFEGY